MFKVNYTAALEFGAVKAPGQQRESFHQQTGKSAGLGATVASSSSCFRLGGHFQKHQNLKTHVSALFSSGKLGPASCVCGMVWGAGSLGPL